MIECKRDAAARQSPGRLFLVFITLIGLGIGSSAIAVPISPGMGVGLAGATPPAGTMLDTMSSNFTLFDDSDPSIVLATGHVDSAVIRELATGLLRFEYQLFVDADSPGNVDFLIAFNFTDFLTDVDFVLGGSGDVAPNGATRSPLSVDGAAIAFFFPGSGTGGGGLLPGQSSLPMFVRTNATAFDLSGLIRVQQGLDIENIFDAFGPTTDVVVVNEPATLTLILTGLIALSCRRRKNIRQ